MPNSIVDLQAALFAQLARVTDPSLSSEALEAELKRSNAVRDLADAITGSNKTALDAAKLFANHGQAVLPHLPQIARAKPQDGSK